MGVVIDFSKEKKIFEFLNEFKKSKDIKNYKYFSSSKTFVFICGSHYVTVFLDYTKIDNIKKMANTLKRLTKELAKDKFYDLLLTKYGDYLYPSLMRKGIFDNTAYFELDDRFSFSVKEILGIQPILNIDGIVVQLKIEELLPLFKQDNFNLLNHMYSNINKIEDLDFEISNGTVRLDVSNIANSIILTSNFFKLTQKEFFMFSLPSRKEILISESMSYNKFHTKTNKIFMESNSPLLDNENILYWEGNKFRFYNEIF